MKKRKISLSFIITILVVGLVTLFLLWSTFYFFSLYVESMKQAAQTSSEQAVTQASNAISNYIGDMQEIMSLIEQRLTGRAYLKRTLPEGSVIYSTGFL